MNIFLNFKIKDYEKWSLLAVQKIIKCIDSSLNEHHFKACHKMIENFILLSIVNSNMTDAQIRTISIQLKSYLSFKKESLDN